MSGVVAAVEASVTSGQDADDVLRSVVSLLAAEPGIVWAGVAFVEGDVLALGPSAGLPDESVRLRTSVNYAGDKVAELWVDGDADRSTLDRICELIADACLVGWDTGGEPWDPAR
jgi:hypothetical protein